MGNASTCKANVLSLEGKNVETEREDWMLWKSLLRGMLITEKGTRLRPAAGPPKSCCKRRVNAPTLSPSPYGYAPLRVRSFPPACRLNVKCTTHQGTTRLCPWRSTYFRTICSFRRGLSFASWTLCGQTDRQSTAPPERVHLDAKAGNQRTVREQYDWLP